MLINHIIEVDEDFDSGGITEPVTLQQVKDYIRLEGFGDDDSGEQDFDFDDSLITALITEGREWVERYTGQYIVPRFLSVVLLNQAGSIRLPGPVIGNVTLANKDAVAITDHVMIGSAIETMYDERVTATYEVGYLVVPDWVKNAIKAYCAWAFENRGDEQTGSPERAAAICRPHRKSNAWA